MGVMKFIFGDSSGSTDEFDVTSSRAPLAAARRSEAQEMLDIAIEQREAESRSAFASAQAAIDRAIAERRAMPQSADGVAYSNDRRIGMPDTRPPGSPERRKGGDRRARQGQTFGRRGN